MILLFGFLFLIIYSFSLAVSMLYAKSIPKDTVIALTGGLGTGKTLIGVKQAVKSHNQLLWLWSFGFMREKTSKEQDEITITNLTKVPKRKHRKKGKLKRIKTQIPMPLLYSNIPIKIKNPLLLRFFIKKRWKQKLPKYSFTCMLTYEHILMIDRLNEYSTIFMDEVGQIADQYSYDNPFVMQSIQEFIRFYRHFIDGRLIVTDQSSSNIVVAVRRRLNVIYNLSEFRRSHIFFHRVNVDKVMISEDMLSIKQTGEADQEYFFGHLPFKWFKFLDLPTKIFGYKKYESRVYKLLYEDVKHIKTPQVWDQYFTKYLIDIPENEEMRKKFKKQGYLSKDEMLHYITEWQKNKAT